MATTQSVANVDEIKGGTTTGTLRVYQLAVRVDGTYLTGTKPNFDILAALQAQHEGVSAVSVKKVVALRDYNDGAGNVYTASNAVIALSSTGNKVCTFTVESGATNGDTGTEVADATALAGYFNFLVVTDVTA